ncbi:MAG: hypothetical protein A2X94_06670 [Bdellovibrionales bacterium GWB1_55_8]|nr:MAG: hypothetical protein A2X94_06670 [Bdellovibrionales bacterium GWB1_55_8]
MLLMCWACVPGLSAWSAGNPCIIQQLGELEIAALVDQVITSKAYWLDPRFGSYLESHPEEVTNLARSWYGSEMFPQMIYPRFREVLGERRAHLMLDPRILCRTDSFLSWSKEHLAKNPNASAEQLRQAFAATPNLRKKSKVFRGMRLNDEAYAFRLKEQGIKSAGLAFQDEAFLREKMLLEIKHKGTTEQRHVLGFGSDLFNRQLNRNLDQSILVSVSDWMELAASVGYHHEQAVKVAPGGKLYLFEIDIPEFEVIRQSGPLLRMSHSKGMGSYQVGEKSIEFDLFKIEAFIPYEVKPEWITAVHPYRDPPPRWEYRR